MLKCKTTFYNLLGEGLLDLKGLYGMFKTHHLVSFHPLFSTPRSFACCYGFTHAYMPPQIDNRMHSFTWLVFPKPTQHMYTCPANPTNPITPHHTHHTTHTHACPHTHTHTSTRTHMHAHLELGMEEKHTAHIWSSKCPAFHILWCIFIYPPHLFPGSRYFGNTHVLPVPVS